MTYKDKYNKSVDLVKQYCPNLTVSLKKDSKLHRAIGWILGKVGNKAYMTDYITTIGQGVAVPGDDPAMPGVWQVILHEGRHAADSQKLGNWLFGAIYLMPQLIGILGILYCIAALTVIALGGPLTLLWGLVALAFVAPLPALGRALVEARGYTVSLAVSFWYGALTDGQNYINSLVEIFSGPGYYFMFPFKGLVRKYFQKKLQALQANTLDLDPYLAACKTLAIEFRS
jgi:hypothetical protein